MLLSWNKWRSRERRRTEHCRSVLGLRRDALCETLDAVLTGEPATNLVRRGLAPCFRRGWAANCDALADGSLDVAALRRLFAPATPGPFPGQRELWLVDGTIRPRPAAKTGPERTRGRFVTAGTCVGPYGGHSALLPAPRVRARAPRKHGSVFRRHTASLYLSTTP